LFILDWTLSAGESFNLLKNDKSQKKRYKAVSKAVKFLANDPFYPSLQTHEFKSLKGPHGEKVWESYAENNTPAAYRIFWYYGTPGRIKIFMIAPHP
jgi:hypothetical protein